MPLADGGEGTLEALGGANRSSTVTGPLGDPVEAEWRLDQGVAVIEMARASGLMLAGGAAGNDPVAATTRGTGELIRKAIEQGAHRVIVGVGGSATTDGGWGALQALGPIPGSVSIEVACDVTTRFLEAAEVYGPQKGADHDQVRLLTTRLGELASTYERQGVDVRNLTGSGAAGGLAGGLASIGAQLSSGFDVVSREVGLACHLDDADIVVTGEGRLDDTSWRGKVVGGVVGLAKSRSLPCFVVVGDIDQRTSIPPLVEVVSLIEQFGEAAAFERPRDGIATLVRRRLERWA